MTLNIKDPQAHALAKALAAQTGETMTQAVVAAISERLERIQRRKRIASADELLAIGRRCAEGLAVPVVDHAAMLYNEQGLPG